MIRQSTSADFAKETTKNGAEICPKILESKRKLHIPVSKRAQRNLKLTYAQKAKPQQKKPQQQQNEQEKTQEVIPTPPPMPQSQSPTVPIEIEREEPNTHISVPMQKIEKLERAQAILEQNLFLMTQQLAQVTTMMYQMSQKLSLTVPTLPTVSVDQSQLPRVANTQGPFTILQNSAPNPGLQTQPNVPIHSPKDPQRQPDKSQ